MNFNFYTKATRTFRLRLKPFSIVVDPGTASPRRRHVFHMESSPRFCGEYSIWSSWRIMNMTNIMPLKKKFLCKKYMPLNNIVVPKQILEIKQIRKSYAYLRIDRKSWPKKLVPFKHSTPECHICISLLE